MFSPYLGLSAKFRFSAADSLYRKLAWSIFFRPEASKLSVFLFRGYGRASCFTQAQWSVTDCSYTLNQHLQGASEQPDTAVITACRWEVFYSHLFCEPLPNIVFLKSSIYLNVYNMYNRYFSEISHTCTFNIATRTSKHKCISNHSMHRWSQPHINPKGMCCCQTVKSLFPSSFSFFSSARRLDFPRSWAASIHTPVKDLRKQSKLSTHTHTHMLEAHRAQCITTSSKDTDLRLAGFLRLVQSYGLS